MAWTKFYWVHRANTAQSRHLHTFRAWVVCAMDRNKASKPIEAGEPRTLAARGASERGGDLRANEKAALSGDESGSILIGW